MNTVERLDARERPPDQLAALFASGWPSFIGADRTTAAVIGRVRERFAHLEIVLLDEHDVPVAAAWGVPLRWSGEVDDLPGGYADSLVRAMSDNAAGTQPDTLVVCAAQVHPEVRGQGLAGEALVAMRDLAAAHGLDRVVVPVRPTSKARYPLTDIDRFARWTRPDGLALDPWIRTHQRLGARIVASAPRSQVMTGTVAEWEAWTGLALPDSGTYVIPDGLATLDVDRDADLGTYVEPGVWLRHR